MVNVREKALKQATCRIESLNLELPSVAGTEVDVPEHTYPSTTLRSHPPSVPARHSHSKVR